MTTARLDVDRTPAIPEALPVPPAVHPTGRYAKLIPPDRRLLLLLGAGAEVTDEKGLATALETSPETLRGQLRGLALGMVEAHIEGWALTEAMRVRVRQDLNAVVGARLVVACAERLGLRA